MIDAKLIMDHLERNKGIILSLFSDFESEEIFWKASDEKWCALEVLCHMIDEEVEDFRTRIKTTLKEPGIEPPKIDPQDWVGKRNYMDQDFNEKLSLFSEERDRSIEFLRSLENPNWKNSYEHKSLGTLSAGMFLKNWLAHDLLHIKQITKLKYDILGNSDNIPISYAGNWT